MGGLNFIGSYSGIDKATIDKLMQAEKMPLVQLAKKQTNITSKQNAWKDVNTRLNSLFEKMKALQNKSTFTAKASTTTNDKNVSMTVGNNATPGSYKVHVKRLATSTSVTGKEILVPGQTNNTKLEKSGSFTINVDAVKMKDDLTAKYLKDNKLTETDIADGSKDEEIGKYIEDNEGAYKEVRTVNFSDTDSLNSITAEINKKSKDTGVSAVIIDGRLSLTSNETGKKDIVLTGVEEDSLKGLGLNKDARTGIEGVGAIFSINDIDDLTSDSNTVKGVLEDVTINLTKAHIGEEYDTVTVSSDNSEIINAVQDFVDQFNSTMSFIDEKIAAGIPGVEGSRGDLAGDNGLMRLQTSLRKMVTDRVSHGEIKDISKLGISSKDKFGELHFDSSKLTKALSENADNVINFFSSKDGDGKDIGFVARINNQIDAFTSTKNGLIKGKNESYEKTLKDLTKQIDNFNARMVKKEAYYIKMFTALDVALMKAESQMDWLKGQVDSMNNFKK